MTYPRNEADRQLSEVTRSEEHLTVTSEAVPVRRAVLRVETTTEEVLVPVTLTRQHVRLDHVDLDPDAAIPVETGSLLAGATSSWLVLTADEPVVTTRQVPVERVRLVTDWVTTQRDVQVQLSHEEVEELPPSAGPAR